ncbi:MAG: hypothetical protein HYU60_04015 [Magnetospirillum sp.]|nr:hypothetical protein [Magnetospirillum sp.]
MPQHRNPAAPDHPNPQHILTEAEIKEFGLEEAPADIGPSWEEIIALRNAHGTE